MGMQSAVSGLGMLALKSFKDKDIVAVCTGTVRLLKHVECPGRCWDLPLTANGRKKFPDGLVMDTEAGGNDTALINHSCDPNAEFVFSQCDGLPLVFVRALRIIFVGEEVACAYNITESAVWSRACVERAWRPPVWYRHPSANAERSAARDSKGTPCRQRASGVRRPA